MGNVTAKANSAAIQPHPATAEAGRARVPAVNPIERPKDLLSTAGLHWLAALSPAELEPAMAELVDTLGQPRMRPEQNRYSSASKPRPASIAELHIPLANGAPLPASIRSEMEAHFGHDFSQVQVHDGPEAARAATAAGARAFTYGQTIVFGAGQYRPDTLAGRALLVHELAHTLHERGAPPTASTRLSQPGDKLEGEAEAAAQQIAAGLPVGRLSIGAAAGQGWIHRKAAGTTVETTTEPLTQMASVQLQLDPERMLDALVWMLVRSLQADPDDHTGRVRRQLSRMQPETRQNVLDRLQQRMSQSQWNRLADILDQPPPSGTEITTTPDPVPAPTDTEAAQPEAASSQDPNTDKEPSQAPPSDDTSQLPDARSPEVAAPSQVPDMVAKAKDEQAEPDKPTTQTEQTAGPDGIAEKEPGEDQDPAKPPVGSDEVDKAAQEQGEAAPSVPEQDKPPQATSAAPAANAAAVPEAAPDAAEQPGLSPEPAATSATQHTEAGQQAAAEPQGLPPAVASPATPAQEVPEPAAESAAPAEAAVPEEANAALDEAGAEAPEPEPSTSAPPGDATASQQAGAGQEPAPPASQQSELPSAELLPPEQAIALGETLPEDSGEVPAETAETGAPEAQAMQAATGTGGAAPAPGLPPVPPSPSAAEGDAVQATLSEPEPEEPAALSPEPAAASETPAAPAISSAGSEPAPGLLADATAEPVGASAPDGSAAEAMPTKSAPVEPEPAAPSTATAMAVPEPAGDAVAAPEAAEATSATPGAEAAGAPDAGAGCSPGAQSTQKPEQGGDAGEDGGGACGGGGGAAPPEQEEAAPPDVAQADPAQAMGTVANLPPGRIPDALGGVSGAVSNTVGKQRDALAAEPPSMERPSGVPASRDASQPVVPPALATAPGAGGVPRAKTGDPIPVAQPMPLPALPPPPTQAIAGPRLPGENKLTEADAAKVQGAVEALPTTDPALNELRINVDDSPQLEMKGDADPQAVQDQQANLDKSAGDAKAQGFKDASQPMGENNVYPTVPQETLTAKPEDAEGPGVLGSLAACAQGGGKALAKAQAGAGKATPEDEAVSIIAKEKSGDQIKGAVSDAQTDMTTKQTENADKISEEKTKSQADIDKAIQDNASEQADERSKARAESVKQRGEWVKQQDGLVEDADGQAAAQVKTAQSTISDEQIKGNKQAVEHIQAGNKEAEDARKDAEDKAKKEKSKGKEDSGGFFGWLSSKVTAFFNSIKAAITAVFDAARKVVKAVIEKVKKLAVEVIEKARKAIVDAIKAAGDLLIKIGDQLLKDFPGLRDKFRKVIQDGVDGAVKTVNKIADKLKEGVQKLLDLLGKALDSLLGLLECALLAAVDVVGKVVQGAINIAKSIAQAIGAFLQLIRDIAPDPGGWIGKLGAAVVDGIRNCLWKAFKKAVKQWFNDKLEEVLGLGMAIWNLLFKGCVNVKVVGKMAWEGLKAAIPTILIGLLIEKLVAMIIPAAGALMAIIEGLKAAWGTISRIIAAFEAFFTFLKAVKSGNAAGPFADAVAMAAVVVIDFVANWLLQRLRKPAGAIGGRLKAMAQKIGATLKKVGKALVGGAKAAGRGMKAAGAAIVRGVKTAAKAVASGARKAGAAVVRVTKRVGQAVARTKVGQAMIRTATKLGRAVAKSKVGKAIAKGARALYHKGKALYIKAKAKITETKQKLKKWWDKRKEDRERRAQEKLQKVAAAIKPKLQSLLRNGTSSLYLWGMLRWWQVRYLLRSLSVRADGSFHIRVNPEVVLDDPKERTVESNELAKLLHEAFSEAEEEYENHLMDDPQAYARLTTAAMMQGGQRAESLQGLSRFEQSMVMRNVGAPRGRTTVEPHVTIFGPQEGRMGMVQNIGRYAETVTKKGATRPGLAAALLQRAELYGVSKDQLAQVLTAHPSQIGGMLGNLEAQMAKPGTSPTLLKRQGAFLRALRRTAFLTQAMEVGRAPGIATSTAVSSTMLREGKVGLEDVMGAGGAMAPMTPVGAAPEGGGLHTSEQQAAAALRTQRVGNIFVELLNTATHQKILVSRGGYDLHELATAIRRFLAVRLREHTTAEDLKRAMATLKVQIIALLKSYHGRG